MSESVLTKFQEKVFGPREYQEDGRTYRITATVRYDDRCGNGHNDFSITAEIARGSAGGVESYGCLHDDVAKHFPELAPLIKWHLCGSDGPMHYVANTVYHAGDRDHNGLRAGEVRDLDAARSTAIWPDATDEDLTAPGLEDRLAARLPALMVEFRAAVESLGFTF